MESRLLKKKTPEREKREYKNMRERKIIKKEYLNRSNREIIESLLESVSENMNREGLKSPHVKIKMKSLLEMLLLFFLFIFWLSC